MTEIAIVDALYRYPVKGLSPEPLTDTILTAGDPLPHDRRFAVENGPSGFDPAAPEHRPKVAYLMLMRHGALARLTTRFDERSGILTVEHDGTEPLAADLGTPAGRDALAGYLTDYVDRQHPGARRGPLRVLEAPGYSFSDTKRRVLSLINLSTVNAIGQRAGRRIDPLRFRGNLHLTGIPAWGEFDWLDRELETQSGVRLKVVKRIDRCAATQVNLDTGNRDLDIPEILREAYGHIDCGVYAEVISGGRLAKGDRLTLVA